MQPLCQHEPGQASPLRAKLGKHAREQPVLLTSLEDGWLLVVGADQPLVALGILEGKISQGHSGNKVVRHWGVAGKGVLGGGAGRQQLGTQIWNARDISSR
jgi:hypothetical protein